jgi:hypothetical protein
MAALLLLLGWQAKAAPVIINFDGGSDAPFTHANPVVVPVVPSSICGGSGFEPGLLGTTTYSYPTAGTGKGYRLVAASAPTNHFTCCALGVCDLANADYLVGRTFSAAPTVYTDFYTSVDILDWDDTVNQVFGLLGNITGLTGGPLGNGLAGINGYAMAYENLEDGDGPNDRLGGALIIYQLTSEAPSEIGIGAAVTLIKGKSYRFTFKRVGSDLTAQIYDLEDLTKPVVSMTGPATAFTTGVCGVFNFARGYVYPADTTFDNYYSDVTDPDTAIAPARTYAIAGTPQVVTRTPANRNQNFWPTASGLSFTAQTFTANTINAAATKLYLNGVDVSGSLVLPANGSTISVSYPGSGLTANTVYSARIELQDVSGTLKSTNTFWFDTFTDAYLASGANVKTIEAEDYNYQNGGYQDFPVPVSGFDNNNSQVNGGGVGYLDLIGNGGPANPPVDYSISEGGPDGAYADYRISDAIRTEQGAKDDISDSTWIIGTPPFPNDTQRSQYAAVNMEEYLVNRLRVNTWLNYTRTFPNINYKVYLRCGSFGDATVSLAQVANPTSTSQTTTPVGKFFVSNHLQRYYFRYEPLMAAGVPAVVNLNGASTIRLTQNGTANRQDRLLDLNYLLFVPTSDAVTSPVVLESSATVNGTYSDAAGASVNLGTKTITAPVGGSTNFYRIRSDTTTTITSINIVGPNVVITYL